MNKFIQINYFLYVVSVSLGVFVGVASSAIANPVSTQECQPVARDVDSRKIYCAHELQVLKTQKKSANPSSGILCYIVRRVFPINAFFDLTQCVPPESGYQVDQEGGPLSPKPKGSQSSLAIRQPLGNTLIASPPDLAWNTIPKAVSYRVSLQQGAKWIWSQETNQAKLKLPPTYSLQPGRSYKLNVVAFNKEGQEIEEEFKTLRLVDPQTLKEIDNAVSASMNSSSNSLVRGIDRAMMLYHADLVDAAVNELRSLTGYQEPAIYLQLGLIYKEAGQKKIAQDYFDKASELANRKAKPLSQQRN